MKIRILFILCLALQFANSQSTLTDYFLVSNERIEITIAKDEGEYVLTLTKGDDDPKTINLGNNVGDFYEFKKQFIQKVYTELLNLPTPVTKPYNDAYKRINDKAESLYFSFANNLRVLDNLDYKPKTGDLKVNEKIPIYLKKKDFDSLKNDYAEKIKDEFKSKILEINDLINNSSDSYILDILILAEQLKIESYSEIINTGDTKTVQETQIKGLTDTLMTFGDEYKALEKKYIDLYFKQYIPKNIDKMVFTYLVIDNVEFEFSRGFLEIIKVTGHLDCTDNNLLNCELIPSFLKQETKIIFTNKYGIGFTSRENYLKLNNVGLKLNQVNKKFTNDNFLNITRDTEIFDSRLKKQMIILMDDLISYDFYVNKLTRDFSPMDQKVKVTGGEKLTLTKEETRKILEVEVFSDFEGFDADSPNGLIQLELSKHFNINTKRYDPWSGLNWLVDGYGWLQYTEIAGGLTKIEDKQRRLDPERIDGEIALDDNSMVFDSQRFTTPIDLLNYSTWNLGQDINLLLIDNPDLQHQFHINAGLRFNRTAIQDSIKTLGSEDLKPEEYSVSFWTFYPEIKMHLLPEERYGFYVMWRPKYVHLISDKIEFQSTSDPLTGSRRRMSNWVNEFEFKGYVDVGDKGQLFLRWRLNHEMGYSANNFSQIQLGYSFFIFGQN